MWPIIFQGHLSNFKATRAKKSPILTQIEGSWTVTSVWIDLWRWNYAQNLMMLRTSALSFFSRSSAKFQGHTAKKLSILTQIGRFRTLTSVWIHWWLWNDAHSLKQHRCFMFFKVIRKISRSHRTKTLTQFEIKEVPYCFSKSLVKFRGHTVQKIADFDPNWAFPDFNSSLNSLIAMTWCTKLDIVEKRCPIVSSRSSIKFRITWAAKSTIWILFE